MGVTPPTRTTSIHFMKHSAVALLTAVSSRVRPSVLRLTRERSILGSGVAGRAALVEGADAFAEQLAPVVRAIRAEGATTLRALADALNRRSIKSARGGTWYPAAVSNLLVRSQCFL